jgi:putative transposase
MPSRWHHRPAHLFLPDTFYFVTARTVDKKSVFDDHERLLLLQNSLFDAVEHYGWELQAWSIVPNHYDIIAKAPEDAGTLKRMLQRVHSQTSREVNKLDKALGRQVWFQYRDTCLTYEKSYYARLHYVMENPVKHGIVANAELYPFCSAVWFSVNADPSFYGKVKSFRFDRLDLEDDF